MWPFANDPGHARLPFARGVAREGLVGPRPFHQLGQIIIFISIIIFIVNAVTIGGRQYWKPLLLQLPYECGLLDPQCVASCKLHAAT